MSLEAIREIELESARRFLPPTGRILELGGGSGYQARLLASTGYDIQSIDLAGRPKPPQEFFPVQDYDGVHLPFGDASFDAIFSSHVLEHVRDLEGLLAETKRVLRPGGVIVHGVPSATWRLWTSFFHYAAAPLRLLRRTALSDAPAATPNAAPSKASSRLRNFLIEPPHGEFPSALSELYFYRAARWRNVLRRAGFEIVTTDDTGIYYSGFVVMPSFSRRTRTRLAKVLGASCHLFVLRPARSGFSPSRRCS